MVKNESLPFQADIWPCGYAFKTWPNVSHKTCNFMMNRWLNQQVVKPFSKTVEAHASLEFLANESGWLVSCPRFCCLLWHLSVTFSGLLQLPIFRGEKHCEWKVDCRTLSCGRKTADIISLTYPYNNFTVLKWAFKNNYFSLYIPLLAP